MGQKAKNLPNAPGVGAAWLGNSAVFAFGDGKVLMGGKAFHPHDGGILALASGVDAIFTCGEDGRVIATSADGVSRTLVSLPKAWLDNLVLSPDSQLLAVSTGREVLVVSTAGNEPTSVSFKPLRAPTSMAFSGNGHLLAIGHSAGVSLFKVGVAEAVWHEFPCSGGPLSVALDQSGDFLFAGLSEPALAGWRLSDGQGFRMGGYPGKPRQLVWSSNGKALLTTGGPALLIWPMTGKDGTTITGPMGQAAGVYRPRLGMVTAIATAQDVAATGWSDGGVDVVNLLTGQFRHMGGARPPKELNKDPRALTTNIISLAFRADGKQLCWINETGAYGSGVVQ